MANILVMFGFSWMVVAAIIGLLLAWTTRTADAQYSIDWSKVSGGGGTSTGGVYSVSGIE